MIGLGAFEQTPMWHYGTTDPQSKIYSTQEAWQAQVRSGMVVDGIDGGICCGSCRASNLYSAVGGVFV